MVVDDEEDVRNTVKVVLEKNGFKVVAAVNGDDCLKKLKSAKKKPDLVLMDIMMPGTPVKEVVPKLKGLKVAYLSVVRMSDAEKERLLKAENIVGFLQKPFNVEELVARVKRLAG